MPETLETPLESATDTSGKGSLIGRGLFWQDLSVGQKFRTYCRTVTETDLVQFVTLTGMIDSTFLDATSAGPMGGRAVPAALTHALIEGFIVQSLIRGTGIAMLACSQEAMAPVRVNDTIHASIEITAIRPTSTHNRAIVDSVISIFNQNEIVVLRYTSKRMLAGRPMTKQQQ
jgi:3-hydroxybutyryl-CoA dehydratase